jgi:hypothetical protein
MKSDILTNTHHIQVVEFERHIIDLLRNLVTEFPSVGAKLVGAYNSENGHVTHDEDNADLSPGYGLYYFCDKISLSFSFLFSLLFCGILEKLTLHRPLLEFLRSLKNKEDEEMEV